MQIQIKKIQISRFINTELDSESDSESGSNLELDSDSEAESGYDTVN